MKQYKIILSKVINGAIRKLIKKYPNLFNDLTPTIEQLKQGEFIGDKIRGFSNSVFKVRVGSVGQKKGKRGGFRVIYYVVTKNKEVVLLTIYAKAKQETITNQEIRNILNKGY